MILALSFRTVAIITAMFCDSVQFEDVSCFADATEQQCFDTFISHRQLGLCGVLVYNHKLYISQVVHPCWKSAISRVAVAIIVCFQG